MQFSHISIGGGITGIETIISTIKEIERKIKKNKNIRGKKFKFAIIDKNPENIPGGVAYGFSKSQYGYFNNPIRINLIVDNEEVVYRLNGQYEEDEFVPDALHEQYADTFSDIKEREVVTGTVVGITDRDVLVDSGFKAEGIIHRTEFQELPEVGQEIDIFIELIESTFKEISFDESEGFKRT